MQKTAKEMFEEDRELLDSMFDYTAEYIDGNILLTVTNYKYQKSSDTTD